MKAQLTKIFIFLGFLIIFSCDAIFEEDISEADINLIFPENGKAYETNNISFYWNEIDGADEYRLQLYNENIIVLDTLIQENSFVIDLNPGNYNWKIQGLNFAYSTRFSAEFKFVVRQSNDLSSQSVILDVPSDNLITNSGSILLLWKENPVANSYELRVYKDGDTRLAILTKDGLTEGKFTLDQSSLGEDAKYSWMVRAVNELSRTQFSERSFYIDRDTPNKPELLKPEQNENFTQSIIQFEWVEVQDEGNVKSNIQYQFELSKNLDFEQLVLSEATDLTTISIVLSANSGTYYWRVKAIDEANNKSDFSNNRSFTIN